MHCFIFELDKKIYQANYRIKEGSITDLLITIFSATEKSDREKIDLDLLLSKKEQAKFFRALKIHSLRYLGT